ncbi:MAG: PKD domain-containing protein [Thermoplasmata archaeon]|nr:PKD domain-containing protein [Thermoplasmata archaeon]
MTPGLSFTPANGTVGTTIAANGTGFAPGLAISFALDGIGVSSLCRSDGTGAFPGTSGTPCTFVVPPEPAGPLHVVASGSTGINVARQPTGVAYDSGTHEIFVSNNLDGTVSVIADSNNTVVATVPVGCGPDGIAYDSRTGDVFVADDCSHSVSVISDSNNTVVTTISLTPGVLASGLTYDNATGQIFVSEAGFNEVGVIDGSNNSIVANITVGGYPLSVVYDPATGVVFTADSGSGNLTLISAATELVTGSVGVGTEPYAEAYDPSTGEIYVVNQGSNNVSVVNDTNNSVVATVTVGNGPDGIAYDSGSGELLVQNALGDTSSLIADSTNAVVGLVADGNSPAGAAYDPGTGHAFIANTGSGNLTLIPTIVPERANGTFSVDSRLVLVPAAGTVRGIVHAKGTGFAPNATLSFTFAGTPVASTCSSDASGTFPGATATPCTFVTPAAPAGVKTVSATDGTNWGNATFSVAPGVTLSPSNGTIGTLVATTGTNFAANSTITFSFAGAAIASTCSSDSSGDFPGTTGTPCTFTVPSAPGGPQTVIASDGTNTADARFSITGGLTLLTTNGSVGSQVAATGTGYPADSSIAFTFAGIPVPSNCSADGTGSFPGTSGTPCRFTVPAAPAGTESVVASRANISAGINVGCGPSDETYDNGTSQIFVVNQCSGNVSVISDLNNSVVTSITLPGGSGADGIAYDSGMGEVFVSNQYSNDVSVISDATDAVVATVGTGNQPSRIAYDGASGLLFVANWGSNNVSVISDLTDTVTATVAVGTEPYGAAYDPATGQVFIENWGSDNVSVISVATETVVASVGVGSLPDEAAYDPNVGAVFVSNDGSFNVSVISDSTDTVVSTVPVGHYPDALAYDANLDDVFVTNGAWGNVSVISDATDTVVATIAVGGGPDAVACDTVQGEVFVANSNSDNVTVIAAGIRAIANFTVDSSVAVETATGTADVGQRITVEGNGYGSDLAIVSISLGASTLSCVSATNGTCVGGVLTTNPNGTFAAQIVVPTELEAGVYSLEVNDSAGDSATTHFSIFSDPNVTVPTATPSSLDLGQSTTFSAVAAFGTGTYTYAWSGLPRGCSGAEATLSCTPSSSGNYSVTVKVTDTNGRSVTSGPLEFTVDELPLVSNPLGTPGSGGADAGQSATFTVAASAGSGTYDSYTWTGLPGECTGSTATVTCSEADLPAGTYTISATVTDSNNGTSAASSPLIFEVNQDPLVTAPTATVSSVDVGQTVSLSASVTLGSSTYSYLWLGAPAGCGGVTKAQLACTPTEAGTFPVQLQVTDSDNASATSSIFTLTVFADPTVAISSSRADFDLGQSVVLVATATLGSGSFRYVWTDLPPGCASGNGTVTCAPSTPGSFLPRVTVKDSNGESAQATSAELIVAPSLSVELAASSTSPTTGQAVEFTLNVSGGTGSRNFSWEFGDGSRAIGSPINHTYDSAGTFTVSVWVNDSAGISIEKNLTVSVSSPANANGPVSNTLDFELLAALIVLAALAVVGFLLIRRGRRGPGAASSDPATDDFGTESSSDGAAGTASDGGEAPGSASDPATTETP